MTKDFSTEILFSGQLSYFGCQREEMCLNWTHQDLSAMLTDVEDSGQNRRTFWKK